MPTNNFQPAYIVEPNETNLNKAACRLKTGKLVGMPTETVYGLAANALDEAAVRSIYHYKNRPYNNPLILHFATLEHLKDYFNLNEIEQELAAQFWPGALSVVLEASKALKAGVSKLCCGGGHSIAVRIPSNKIARKLIQLADVPLAAPSANIANYISPTKAVHVLESFLEKDLMIIDGGPSVLGLESTVVHLIDSNSLEVLRKGSITLEELHIFSAKQGTSLTEHETSFNKSIPGLSSTLASNRCCSKNPEDLSSIKSLQQLALNKSPGMMLKHYSPKTPVRLNATFVEGNEALLAFGSYESVSGQVQQLAREGRVLNLSSKGDLVEASRNLFAMLWELDKKSVQTIAVMSIPMYGLGAAINERLLKASAK